MHPLRFTGLSDGSRSGRASASSRTWGWACKARTTIRRRARLWQGHERGPRIQGTQHAQPSDTTRTWPGRPLGDGSACFGPGPSGEAMARTPIASLSPVSSDPAWPPAYICCGCHHPGRHSARTCCCSLPTSAGSAAASCPRAPASAPRLSGPHSDGGSSERACPDRCAPAAC